MDPPERRKGEVVIFYAEVATKVCLLLVAALEVLRMILHLLG